MVNGNDIIEFIESKNGALEEEFIKANSGLFVEFCIETDQDCIDRFIDVWANEQFMKYAEQQYSENGV